MEPALPPLEPVDDDEWIADGDEFEPEKAKRESAPDIPVPVRRRRRAPWWVISGCVGCLLLCCGVPVCLGLVGSAAFFAYRSNEVTATGTAREEIAPDSTLTLTVNNSVGDVTIRAGADDEVLVDYTKKAYGWSKDSARRQLENFTVTVDQPAEGDVNVTVDSDKTDDIFGVASSQVNLTITVPPDLALVVKTSIGKIEISEVNARALDVSTSIGEITFAGGLGTNVNEVYRIQSSTGTITVRLPRDSYVEIDASSNVGGVTIASSFPQIDVTSADQSSVGENWVGVLGEGAESPPTLTLRTNTGEITVTTQ